MAIRIPRNGLNVPDEISDLKDLQLTSPSNLDMLIWSTAVNKWVNVPQRLPQITAGDAGKVLKVNDAETHYELAIPGGGGGVPTDLVAGARIILEADAGLGLSDGDPVSQWTDQSGDNHQFTQSSTARPTFRAQDDGDALPWVEFDGSNDYLLLSGLSPAITASEFTIFLIMKAKHSASAAFNGILSMVTGTNTDWSNTASVALTTYNQNLTVERNSVTFAAPINQVAQESLVWDLYCVRYSTSLGFGVLSIWKNAVRNNFTVTNAALNADIISLGSRYLSGAPGNYLKCGVRALSIYESALSMKEVRDNMEYYAAKWGIPR